MKIKNKRNFNVAIVEIKKGNKKETKVKCQFLFKITVVEIFIKIN